MELDSHLNTGGDARNRAQAPHRNPFDDRIGQGRPPVVLQVLPALVTGVAERGCIDVALALAQAGAVPLVASQGGPMTAELDRAGIRHITLPLASKNPLVIRRNARKLEAVIREQGVDIVHARSRAPALPAAATGPAICAIRSDCRSAAERKARRCRGSTP